MTGQEMKDFFSTMTVEDMRQLKSLMGLGETVASLQAQIDSMKTEKTETETKSETDPFLEYLEASGLTD